MIKYKIVGVAVAAATQEMEMGREG